MKHFLIFIFILVVQLVRTQQLSSLKVQCFVEESQEKVVHAELIVKQKDVLLKQKTDKKGQAVFLLDLAAPFTIEAKHGYYGSVKLELNPENYKDKQIPNELVVYLPEKLQEVKEIVVTAPGIPQVVYQSKTLSVADFELLPRGEILLLLYPKTLKKGSELAVLSGTEIISRFELPEKPLELIRDFRQNPHVICENGVYGIHRSETGVGISTLDKLYFTKYVMPIIDTAQSKLYFSNFNKFYPAFDYQLYDQADSAYSTILEIKDDLMMELYRSEYKWVDIRTKLWAKEKEMETGIDKEIWVGANYFTQSIYYKELYAPMFKKNDSIFVFDYYKDKLFTFDLKGNKTDSINMFHHYNPKKTGWKRHLLQDQENGNIYAFCEKDGVCSLRLIDTKSGNFVSNIEFQHRYIDKIAVKGGVAYYVYRPYESAQKKFLYQTKLP